VDVLKLGVWNEYMNHIHYEINLQYENTELRKCLSQLSVVDTQLTFCLGS